MTKKTLSERFDSLEHSVIDINSTQKHILEKIDSLINDRKDHFERCHTQVIDFEKRISKSESFINLSKWGIGISLTVGSMIIGFFKMK